MRVIVWTSVRPAKPGSSLTFCRRLRVGELVVGGEPRGSRAGVRPGAAPRGGSFRVAFQVCGIGNAKHAALLPDTEAFSHSRVPSFPRPSPPQPLGSDVTFVCEQVCTSDRLLRRMGSLARDPAPGSCVTVCGDSAPDACTSACALSVCVNVHQVPAWNDACIARCTSECLRGRAGN